MNEKKRSRAIPRAALAAGLALAVGGCTAGGAAEPTSIKCEATEAGGFPAMSLVFEGNEAGTLTIASTLGEIALPASREERQGENEGATYSVTGILASGPGNLLMPDKAAMEACIAGRTPGEQAEDADFVTMAMDACRREVPLAAAPVPITARVEIAIMDPPGAYMYLTLTYADKSDVPGEHITIETLPPPNCSVAEPQ